jgi:hypothetical protein
MAKKQDVVSSEENKPLALAVSSDDFSQYANAGMENVGSSDILIPRMTILQQMSPQLNRTKSEYIKGAEIGSIADVGTGEIFPDGILFLPVYYRKDFLEWAPRSTGKGLITIHTDSSILDACKRDERNQPILPNGNLIAETAQWFGLNLTADGRKSFIPMGSTQLKKSKRWMTLATGERLQRADGGSFTPPLFYRSYQLTTAQESNNQGDWAGWKVERALSMPELGDNWREIRDICVAFREQLIAGEARGEMADSEDIHSTVEGVM